MIPTAAAVVLFVGVSIAAITDTWSGRIPNLLVGAMLLGGAVVWGMQGDWVIPGLGFLLATAIHFPLWVLGIQKAGDAKLFMGIGANVGWEMTLEATFWYAAIYLPVGLLILVVRGRLGNLGQTLLWQLHEWLGALPAENRGPILAALPQALQEKPPEEPESTPLRTAPVIAAASVGAYFTDWLLLT